MADAPCDPGARSPALSSEELFRFIVESAKDYSIFAVDPQNRIVSWNTGAERLFGYSEAEIIGRDAALLFTPEDRERGEHERELGKAARVGRAEDDRWHLRKDGSRLWMSGIVTPLRDEAGGLRGFVKVARDLTSWKQAEEERDLLLGRERDARALAEAANRLKDEFLATLSHELRNPLNSILANAEVLLLSPETKDIARVQRASSSIQRNALAQARLISDLLDLSRLQVSKLVLDRRPTTIGPLIAETVDSVRATAREREIRLEVEIPAEPFVVDVDPLRLKQIAWNLLSNALKFTRPRGEVRIGIERADGDARLVVQDTGQGIDPEFLPHVFDMFRQADPGTTRQHGGMGIGLALVRQLVELQGGSVSAESEGRDRGARFIVSFPLSAAEPAPEAAVPGRSAGALRGLHVLLIDDTPDTVQALHDVLELEGAFVHEATSGREALTRARTERFDVVLSDIGMPDMDGYDFLRKLRRRPEHRDVPAIALTGFGRSEDVARSRAAGFVAHLVKPIVADDLIEAVRAVLAS